MNADFLKNPAENRTALPRETALPLPNRFSRRAPAKLNLMLAVTGTRADGFHELVSLVVPVPALFDELELQLCPGDAEDSLECVSAAPLPQNSARSVASPAHDFARGVPVDASNLVLRAAAAFRKLVPAFPRVKFLLKKGIPHGAGLGGGSSDASAALLLLADAAGTFFGKKFDATFRLALRELSATLGSDCPLFFAGKPVVMRGRGERLETLSEVECNALAAKKFLIFKPAFSVSTAEAYGAMKRAAPKFYTPADEAERRLAAWRAAPERAPFPFFNDIEAPVFQKFAALPAIFEILRERFALDAHMSGSGSACFAEISEKTDVPAVADCVRECLGETAFFFAE